MKPHEEEWSLGEREDTLDFKDIDGQPTEIAVFSAAEQGWEENSARARLAAQAPKMARLLLAWMDLTGKPGKFDLDAQQALRDAGVIE